MKQKLPVYVALDVDAEATALSLAHTVSPYVEGFKIGPRLYLKCGPSLVAKLKPLGKIFLDFKFFDIPSTMESAVRAGFHLGVDLVTVHAQAGEESLKLLAELEKELKSKRDFRILAVTMLTSFSKQNPPPFTDGLSLPSCVEHLSQIVMQAGLSGLVCSGGEVAFLRKQHPKAYLVTPGIRWRDSLAGDQKRVVTPQQAQAEGADALVIGRPIYKAEDPVQACLRLQKELK